MVKRKTYRKRERIGCRTKSTKEGGHGWTIGDGSRWKDKWRASLAWDEGETRNSYLTEHEWGKW